MGLAIAEAQVAGAAIVAPAGWVKAEMLVPAAAIPRTTWCGDSPARPLRQPPDRRGSGRAVLADAMASGCCGDRRRG